MSQQASVPPGYFDRLYAANPDPWAFETSAYERAKYDATIGALGGRHFANALELGCSIGVLTHHLARSCDALLGVDVAEAALVRARLRCAGEPHVRFVRAELPSEWPAGGPFDLIVVSELLYFLSEAGLIALAARVCADLAPRGVVVLVHWLGSTETAFGGEAASETFLRAAALHVTQQSRTDAYRLDVLCR